MNDLAAPASLEEVRQLARRHLIGRELLVDALLVALLSGGHVLIEGAPGLAKTRAVKLLAAMVEAEFSRVQATPDLLPADLTGTEVFRQATGAFDFVPGPLFANIVLVDEINRAPPKVQSALLEAMAERQVTTGRVTRPLPWPFLVAATQNPIEHEGTYPLPEAQLDRFLFCVEVGMPDLAEEAAILDLALAEAGAEPMPALRVGPGAIAEARDRMRAVHIAPAVRDYAVRLVAATRGLGAGGKAAGAIEHPASPRATIGLAVGARGFAFLERRDHVLPEDVARAAPLVLTRRIGLSYRARAEGVTPQAVVEGLLAAVSPL